MRLAEKKGESNGPIQGGIKNFFCTKKYKLYSANGTTPVLVRLRCQSGRYLFLSAEWFVGWKANLETVDFAQ